MSKYCDICSLYFFDNYALQGHLGGKRHLKKLQQVQITERSIVLSPLPKFVPARRLIHFFELYGAIKWYRFYSNSLSIEFYDREPAEALLKKPIWIDNVRLNIKRQILHNITIKQKSENTSMENTGLISYDNIKHKFEKKETFDDQLVAFLNAVQLTDTEIEEKYESICTQLDKIFKVVFPKCKTYKFGSTQTGLGFKESDLDVYMDIGEPIYEDNTSAEGWTLKKIFKEVKRIMHRMNCIFSKIISISKARMPIIKFCYIQTNVCCDISFTSSLGLYKGYLIKYYISLDNRLRPLMILIKYWARHFKISGTGRMSKYALMLLIIFYLQQPSVNIIPTLIELQKMCQPQIVSGWQVNFDENMVLPAITNKNTIPQLLHGFFSFYANFEFKGHVICPLDGKVHTESEFEDINNLPQFMATYKTRLENENFKLNVGKRMCVQDPIELSHNVTLGIPFPIVQSFVQYCALGAEICTMSSKNDYKDLMKTLLTIVLKNKAPEGKYKVIISANHVQSVKESNNVQCTDVIEQTKLTNNDWYLTVFNIVKDIFEKVFKVQVEIVTDVAAKQQKVEILSDVHAEKHQKIIFHCTGSHCVWRNRAVNSIILDPSLSCLQKEALLSDQTIENCNKQKSVNKVNLDFICTFEKKAPSLRVILTISNKNCDNHIFSEFMYFSKHKLVEITKQTLTYIQQFNKCY